MAKTKDFTPDELSFLFEKIERGIIVTERERIDLNMLTGLYQHMSYRDRNATFPSPEIHLNYKNKNLDTKNIDELKQRVINALLNGGEFEFESNGDDYGYSSDATLVLYDSRSETEDEYMNRLYSYGREIIYKEKIKQKRNAKKEARKVLFEKTKKKIKKSKKEHPVPVPAMHRFENLRPLYPHEDFPF